MRHNTTYLVPVFGHHIGPQCRPRQGTIKYADMEVAISIDCLMSHGFFWALNLKALPIWWTPQPLSFFLIPDHRSHLDSSPPLELPIATYSRTLLLSLMIDRQFTSLLVAPSISLLSPFPSSPNIPQQPNARRCITVAVLASMVRHNGVGIDTKTQQPHWPWHSTTSLVDWHINSSIAPTQWAIMPIVPA